MPPLALGTLMATIDISAVNIALPTLSRTFRVPITTVEWVVLAYVVTITGLLLSCGRLADRWGRRRVYGTGLAIFTVASGLCAAATGPPSLFAARALQGLGAAMMTANSGALLVSHFPTAERGRALGAFGAMVGVGLALGPPLGGLLVEHLSWRWIFIVNLPIGLLAQWLLRTHVPPDVVADRSARLDPGRAAVWCAALVAVMLGLSRGPATGWTDLGVLALLGAGIALLFGFGALEWNARDPLLPRSMVLGPIGATGLLTLIGQLVSIAVGIHMPLYFEDVLGFEAARSGRWLMVMPATALLCAPLAGRWSDRWGTRRVSGLGMAIALPGFLLLATLGTDPGTAHVIGGLIVIGLGLGLFTVPNASALFGAARGRELGLASGIQATMRNLGIAGGVALTAAIIASRYAAHGGGALVGSHAPIARAAFALATRDFYLVMAGIAVLALGLIARKPGPAPRGG